MAATIKTVVKKTTTKPPRTTKLVCFSYAAYAKNLIDHLKSLNIPVLPGLNDSEFADIESTFGFIFPPDLRSILREGLPIGPAFPNWRSSSHQQLHILVNLPVLSLSKNVTLNNFWSGSWGSKPRDKKNDALSSITKLLDGAPVLVPIYRNCYVPSTPNMAGNPVFYIDTDEVRVLSFDLAGFFKEVEFVKASGSGFFKSKVLGLPAWAAKEARRIEFWTDVAERGMRAEAHDDTRAWWIEDGLYVDSGLECCLEDVFRRLRDGGWTEEEVKEMMMMMDGCDDDDDDASRESTGVQLVGNCRGGVGFHVRLLSGVLLRAGWSKDDVVYSLNLQDQENLDGVDSLEGNSDDNYFEFQRPIKCSKEGGDHDHCHQRSSIKHLMHVHALQVLSVSANASWCLIP